MTRAAYAGLQRYTFGWTGDSGNGDDVLQGWGQSGGVPTVADSYGSVLLRGGASAYIVVGIAAFAVGVTVTMICIRLKNKSKDRTVSTEERED